MEGLEWINHDGPLTMAGLRGKIVLLDFWTYGCVNCMHVIPDLQRLEAEYAEELVVIGVHSAKFSHEAATESIRQVVLRYDIEHPVVNDSELAVWQAWGVRAWPTTVLIDPDGNVVGGHEGEGVYEVVQPAIEAVIAEYAGRIDPTPVDTRPEPAAATVLSFPGKVHADPAGSRLFVADSNHHRVVVADLETGEALAVYGTGAPGYVDGAAAQFRSPQGMVLDGNVLYVADTGNHAIRAIDLGAGVVSTLAGTGIQGSYPPAGGPGATTALFSPWDLALMDGLVVVAMAGSHQLWTIDPDSGNAKPFVGNGRESVAGGPFDQAELAQPSGVSVIGELVVFADSESSSIRVADSATGQVRLLAGAWSGLFDWGVTDGIGRDARFQHPLGVTGAGMTAYVADTYNSRLRTVDLGTGATGTLAGSTPGWADGSDPRFWEPGGIHLAAGLLYVADTNNHSVRVVDPETGFTTTFVLKGLDRFEPDPGTAGYRGKLVEVASVSVAPGSGRIELDVSFPSGYKVNPEAPSTFTWSTDGGISVTDGALSLVNPAFPLHFEARFDGSGTLIGDLSVVYCESETESICLLEQVRVVVPVEVQAGGETRLPLRIVVELPEGF